MKKLTLFALTGAAVVTALMSSCTKDTAAIKPTPKFNYDNKDLKTVIKLANPNLYEKMFVQKDIIDRTVLVIKGANDGFGNCDDGDCICTVIVITTYPGLTANDSINVTGNSPNVTLSFAQSGDGALILATPDSPKYIDPAKLSITTLMDGRKRITYVPY